MIDDRRTSFSCFMDLGPEKIVRAAAPTDWAPS